jgi:hypothetical protein
MMSGGKWSERGIEQSPTFVQFMFLFYSRVNPVFFDQGDGWSWKPTRRDPFTTGTVDTGAEPVTVWALTGGNRHERDRDRDGVAIDASN